MFKYFGFYCDPANVLARARINAVVTTLTTGSSTWASVLNVEDLMIVCADIRQRSLDVCRLHSENGVGVGTFFTQEPDSDGNWCISAFSESATRRLIESHGRSVTDEFWGRYVLFMRSPAERTLRVIRDPTGQLPCYYAQTGEIIVFFSAYHPVLNQFGIDLSINWGFMSASACDPNIQCAATGLAGITELQPGECIEIKGGLAIHKRFYWLPGRVASSGRTVGIESSVANARETVQRCVEAWASVHPRIIHRLSGGLDSSIVALCLRNARLAPTVLCANYVTANGGDERHYAQMIAAQCGFELLEHTADSTTTRLDLMPQLNLGPHPRILDYHLRNGDFEDTISRQFGASAFFDGVGGDHCFFQSPIQVAVGESFLEHGLSGAFLRTLFSVAIASRQSIWSVLRRFLRNARQPLTFPPAATSRVQDGGLTEEARRQHTQFSAKTHPWLGGADLSDGVRYQIWHMLSLANAHTFYHPFLDADDSIESVSPLSSQPVLECCLRIPLLHHLAHGWDRAVERRAFADVLPDELVHRREKGRISNSTSKLVLSNRRFLLEFMLDGELVKHGILDRAWVEQELTQAVSPSAMGRICYHYFSTEKWLQEWRDVRATPRSQTETT